MRHHVLDLYGVHIYLASTKREWKELRSGPCDWLTKCPTSVAGLAWFNAGAPPVLVLWVNLRRHTEIGELIDTCAHEALHGALEIMEHINYQPAGHNEPLAYTVGWLTRWIYEGVIEKFDDTPGD